MRQLLKNNVPFKWTPTCDAELQYIKDCLVSDPVLKPLDPTRDIVISTDGSIYGLGFCIMQADDSGDLHAVSYRAQATTASQANYTADDLDACALMYALKSVKKLAIH